MDVRKRRGARWPKASASASKYARCARVQRGGGGRGSETWVRGCGGGDIKPKERTSGGWEGFGKRGRACLVRMAGREEVAGACVGRRTRVRAARDVNFDVVCRGKRRKKRGKEQIEKADPRAPETGPSHWPKFEHPSHNLSAVVRTKDSIDSLINAPFYRGTFKRKCPNFVLTMITLGPFELHCM